MCVHARKKAKSRQIHIYKPKQIADTFTYTHLFNRHIHIYTPIQPLLASKRKSTGNADRERRQGMQTGEADRDSRPQMPTANADMVDSDSRQQSRCTTAKADNTADVLQPKQRGQGGIHTKLNPKIQPNPTPKLYT